MRGTQNDWSNLSLDDHYPSVGSAAGSLYCLRKQSASHEITFAGEG